MTPVCVTVTDQQVDEVCEDRMVDATCFKRECKTGSEEVCVVDLISIRKPVAMA
jgi:hypothetical protein